VILVACAVQIVLVLTRTGRLTSDLDLTIRALRRNQQSLEDTAEEHRLLEAQYQTLLTEVPAVTYTAEPGKNGRWLYVSPRIESMTGYPSERWTGDPDFWFSQLHPEDQERVSVQERLSEVSLSPMRIEYRLCTRHGREIWVRDEAVPIERDGVVLMQGFMTEITAEKEAQAETSRLQKDLQQAQKMEAVGQLAGGIAHDFNNLLAVVINYCGFIYDEVDEELKLDLEEVLMAARRGADLTRQLLTFSRHQTASQEIVNLNQVVAGMEKMLRRVIPENIRLSLDLEPSLWSCTADIHQIEQVIMNLTLNAKDAMASGGRLEIKTHNEFSPTGEAWVSMEVTADGHGFDQEVRHQMFEPFFTTKGIGGGTGLGLAVVYGIVERVGGQIEVTSKPGLGTTFQILLPASEKVALGEPVDESTQAPAGNGERILVVENEEAVRTVTTRLLTRAGYQVTAAASGEAALLTIEQGGKPDLLVTDIVMPGISGWELARTLGMKTLYMSGYPMEEPDPGGHRIVRKPFENRELLEAVADALGRTEPALRG
jgi:PAS domain S-box-containing protein